MCGVDRRAEMSAEESEVRKQVVTGLENLLTLNQWQPLLAVLKNQIEMGHMCAAVGHSLDARYFPKEP